MYGIWTLDSHEYYGPFLSKAGAQKWAQDKGLTSFQVVDHLDRPEYKTNWRAK